MIDYNDLNVNVRGVPKYYWGDLLVAGFAGLTSSGERKYVCICACGTSVVRCRSQLELKKLQRCDACAIASRQESTTERLESKTKFKHRKQERQFKFQCFDNNIAE